MAIYLLQIVYESQNILIDLGKQISETFIHIFPNTLWSVFRINPYLYSNTWFSLFSSINGHLSRWGNFPFGIKSFKNFIILVFGFPLYVATVKLWTLNFCGTFSHCFRISKWKWCENPCVAQRCFPREGWLFAHFGHKVISRLICVMQTRKEQVKELHVTLKASCWDAEDWGKPVIYYKYKELRLGSYEIGHVKTKGEYFVSCRLAWLGRPAVGLAGWLTRRQSFPGTCCCPP